LVLVSQAGFDGDPETRLLTWKKETPKPCHDRRNTLKSCSIAGVLASVGSVGDAYDNAMAESFVDTFKTELLSDRVWRTRSQLELAVVEYVAWFNHERLHESLG
jgi:transposase InsO family protein